MRRTPFQGAALNSPTARWMTMERNRPGRPLLFALLGLVLLVSPSWVEHAAGAPQLFQRAEPPKPPPTPMDQPLTLATAAKQNYDKLQDYTCTFLKQDRVRGRLEPDNIIALKCRTKPFSVHLRWLAPRSLSGQEVCYVAGRNNGLMKVRSAGLLGTVGFISMSPSDPRAMESNRHPITDVGIGHLIDTLVANWEMERQVGKTEVQIADFEYNKRPCTRVETIHADRTAANFYAYRCVTYFDKANHLPIRFEAYDWPRPGGPPQGDLLECYGYIDLRLNTGLGDGAFNY